MTTLSPAVKPERTATASPSLGPSFTAYSTWSTSRKTELDPYVSRLINEVKLQMTALPDLSDARWPVAISAPLTATMASQQTDVRNRINESTRQLEAAALLWRLKKDPIYLNEALKRGDQLASLNPSGPTSYANQDQATRQIARELLKGADRLAGDLDATRKAKWLAVANTRVT